MKQLAAALTCSHCGLKITRLAGEHRCRKCNAPLCDPYLRLCWEEHYAARHGKGTR